MSHIEHDRETLALNAMDTALAAQDPDYPRIHIAPPLGRLNDPNGLLIDGDTFHAFYQFTPLHGQGEWPKWIFWGHASSTDGLHWERHRPALAPVDAYDAHGVYSGSALVLSEEEAASLGTDPFQLFFTGNLKGVNGERFASQNRATSADLQEFVKDSSNPLIPTQPAGYTAHFRDPHVMRVPEEQGLFRMLLGVQRANGSGAALLYTSRDLKQWECQGEMTFPDAGPSKAMDHLGYMWECPGLVRLRDEADGALYDVLIWSPQGLDTDAEGFDNVDNCVYTVGVLDGTEFRGTTGTVGSVSDAHADVLQLDRGFEFYAPQAYAHAPGEDTHDVALIHGWVGNPAQDDLPSMQSPVPAARWVHALTMVRELRLRGGRIYQQPHLTDLQLTDVAFDNPADGSDHTITVDAIDSQGTWLMDAGAQMLAEGEYITIHIGSHDVFARITLARESDSLVLDVDRSASRYTIGAAVGGAKRRVTLPDGCAPKMRVLHDASITEIFAGDGDCAFTMRTFVDPGAVRVSTNSANIHISIQTLGEEGAKD